MQSRIMIGEYPWRLPIQLTARASKPRYWLGYIEYHSVRFRTCKALTASRRPLTDTERISIEAQIKQEWSEMNDKDHAVWTLRSQTRRRQPSPPAISDERPAFCGLRGASKSAKHPNLWQVLFSLFGNRFDFPVLG